MPRNFEELFNPQLGYNGYVDEIGQEGIVGPALGDVAPSLVSGGSARYSSKELNARRGAVSGRAYRSANIRSNLTPPQADTTQPRYEYNPAERVSANRADPRAGGMPGDGVSLIGNQAIEEAGGDVGREADPLGYAVGDSIAGDLGVLGVGGMVGTAATGMGLGASTGDIAKAMPGGFTMGALGNVFGLANTLGGAVAAGQMGHNAGNEAARGFSPNPAATGRAQTAAFDAVNPGIMGLIGMGGQGATAALGGGSSLSAQAQSAAGHSFAETISPHWATQAQEPNAFDMSLTHDMSGVADSTAGQEATGPTAGPIDADMTGINAEIEANLAAQNATGGQKGTVSQALQGMGFGGTSGVMGIGTGGLTDASTGQINGAIQSGINPHFSEMSNNAAASAASPTVGGMQGTGQGQTGQGATGRGDNAGGGGAGAK
jgi:hypothetical protein